MDMPKEIVDYLKKRQKDVSSPCGLCNSSCCNGPGFAILENIIIIYDKYQKNELNSESFTFISNLDFSSFIMKYFDRVLVNGKLLLFFPKMRDSNDSLIPVPPWNFWQARDYIRNRTKSYGCIFLSKKQIEGDYTTNKCILHGDQIMEAISQKPIDCLFLYCIQPGNVVHPSEKESTEWFELLDRMFPNSRERFSAMCPGLPD